jgi:DNA topoisomerase IB
VARLRRVDSTSPGLTRRRSGKGFTYLKADGSRVPGEARARIEALAIPPAWIDVWICPDENGHLQAVGTDAAGRRQYLYHERWRKRRDQEKFDHALEFARALPRLRAESTKHLALEGFPAERVLACATRLLDRGFFRVGSESYAELNGSYGLATMKKRHVRVDGDEVVFDYLAKGGKHRVQSIVDPAVAEVVHALKRRRAGGPELLAYRAQDGWHDVRSNDINEYLREITDGVFSAKDFRTWHATVLAAVFVAQSEGAQSRAATKTSRKRAVSAAVRQVSEYLGNTPAVCRASYIDPRVFDRFRAGHTIAGVVRNLDPQAPVRPWVQARIEEAVLDLLEDPAGRLPKAA